MGFKKVSLLVINCYRKILDSQVQPVMALPARSRTIVAGLAVGSIGTGLLLSKLGRNVDADANAPQAVFGRGPAFVSLPLESSEQVNHDTKRLKFSLPHATDVSGLSLTCKSIFHAMPSTEI